MQRFKEKTNDSLYYEEMMAEGYTTPHPYCVVNEDGTRFDYPWHQYYADSDCIWMALEYHPKSG